MLDADAPRLPAPAAEPAPAGPRDPQRPAWRRVGAGLLVAVAFLAQFATKLKGLLLLLPKLKLFTTSASMLVSIAAYTLIFTWKFAVGFVLLLLVHEMGHVIQLRREGIKASAPVFIPFLGAAVAAKSLGGNALAEARVGLAGPVLGTLGALALVPIALATGSELLYAVAYIGFFLNLFNLLPVLPLDGGRAFAAMAPWMWFVGLTATAGLLFVQPNPVLLLVLLLGGLETWRRWRAKRSGDEEERAFYRVRPRHRFAVLGVYVGLIVVCALGMDLMFLERDLSDV